VEKQTIVFTGGGTGGHVYPGIAVLERLRKEWAGDVLWVGSAKGMERAILEARAIPFYGVPSGKLRRYFSLRTAVDAFRVLGGFFVSLMLFIKIRPRMVFSKGGYVSVPPVYAARLLGIPVISHESDFDPGLATLMNARCSRKVLVPYEDSAAAFPAALRDRLVVTGNPVREEIFSGSADEGFRFLGFSRDKPVLLVLGGSQGAREINILVRSVLDELLRFCGVIHQMGPLEFEPLERPGYRAVPYLYGELAGVLAAADAVVSRAGAGALWEILAAGKPSLLVPLRGQGTRGDQVRNAEYFRKIGAAAVLSGDPIDPGRFLDAVRDLFGPGAEKMRDRIRGIEARGASDRIVRIIMETMAKES
jgi:UDP-N-acetylglucosamine--N-acetylmuramyl-(pentapeptide) pyrophosphoryl-undecaprenol N-acetylglucosamine transferase